MKRKIAHHTLSFLIGAALAVAILLYAPSRPIGPQGGADELLAVDRAFAELAEQEGVKAAWANAFAQDAVGLPAGAHARLGREALLQDMENFPEEAALTWRPSDAQVSEDGSMGYTWGTFVMDLGSSSSKSGAETQYGKYLTVWRRQADGQWKAVVDMGNSSPGPAPRVTSAAS